MSTKLAPFELAPVPGLVFGKMTLDEAYAKEWRADNLNDFLCLLYDGKLVSDTLYRVGGLGTLNFKKGNYLMLLKHTEDIYSQAFMHRCYDKEQRKRLDPAILTGKHLKSQWCIIDKQGVEKQVFDDGLNYPYLIKNSVLYGYKDRIWNIESGYEYGRKTGSTLESEQYLFFEYYGDDERKQGIMRVNKKTGTWKVHK